MGTNCLDIFEVELHADLLGSGMPLFDFQLVPPSYGYSPNETAPDDSSDFIFDADVLWYDADGTGTTDAVQIASVSGDDIQVDDITFV